MICKVCYIEQAQHKDGEIFLCTKCLNKKNKEEAFKAINKAPDRRANERRLDIAPQTASKTASSKFCSFCNFSEADFEATGYLGCENCYKQFESVNELADIYQGKGVIHKGKRC